MQVLFLTRGNWFVVFKKSFSVVWVQGIQSVFYRSRNGFSGAEEGSRVSSVCQVLDFLCFLDPQFILVHSGLSLDFRFCLGMFFFLLWAVHVILPCSESLPLHIDMMFNLSIIAIKPVLMFSFLVANCFFTSVQNGFIQWSLMPLGCSVGSFSWSAIWSCSCFSGSFRLSMLNLHLICFLCSLCLRASLRAIIDWMRGDGRSNNHQHL